QSRREPRIEHVRNLLQLRAAAFRASARRLARDDNFFAGVASPRRNAMPPPQLARDAPVVNIVHPVQINLAVVVGDDGDLAALDRLDRLLRQRLDLDEPLLRKPRLDHGAAAVALAEGESVVFFAY